MHLKSVFFQKFPPHFFTIHWKYRTIRSILLVYFLAIIAIPFISLGVFGPIIYMDKLRSETEAYAVQMLSQVTKNIDFHIQEVEKLCLMAASSSGAEAFFSQIFDSAEHRDVYESMSIIKKTHPEIAGILLLNSRDEVVSGELERVTRDSLLTEPWYNAAVVNPEDAFLYPRPIGRNIRSKNSYESENVVSVVRSVPSGVVLIDVRLSTIEKIFIGTRLGPSGFFFILDSANEIVYAPINDIVYRVNPRWFEKSSTNIIRPINGSKYQIISLESDYTNWRTVGVFPLADMQKEVEYLQTYSMVVAIITIFLSVIASFFLSGSIARPVGKLCELMSCVESGDLSVRYLDRGHNEFDRLGYGFNSMLLKIEELIEVVYREQKNMREAELKILQAQIKPHFLYNTLDTIQWMAREHNADDVADLVTALTNLFRLGLSGGREVISVREELKHVISYLIIQKVRYEDKFDYSIDVSEDLFDYSVLKVILQPLVENAIYHGVKEKRGKGHIKISACIELGKLIFYVSDTGCGITPDVLSSLNSRLSSCLDSDEVPGYALFNVQSRIRLSSGKDYGLKIESTEGEGTTVIVVLPLTPFGGDI